MTPEEVARLFHEAYERLAPSYGYETRKASAVPWESVPEPNRSLMVAVASEVLARIVPADAPLDAPSVVVNGRGVATGGNIYADAPLDVERLARALRALGNRYPVTSSDPTEEHPLGNETWWEHGQLAAAIAREYAALGPTPPGVWVTAELDAPDDHLEAAYEERTEIE